MAERTQKLRAEVEVTGADKGAKDIGAVTGATKNLVDKTAAGAESFDKAAKKGAEGIERITTATEGLIEKGKEGVETVERVGKKAVEVGESIKGVADSTRNAIERLTGIGIGIGHVAAGAVALVAALRATSAAFRVLPLASTLIHGIMGIVDACRQEVAARLRVAETIRAQGRALDELLSKQLTQRETLSRIAGRRQGGGFESADVERRVQQQAVAAQAQFPRLTPEDINLAFGTFGDVEGLSREDLTDLAILASFGELQVDPRRSPAARQRSAQRQLRRPKGRDRIARYHRVETEVGGVGDLHFRGAQPSERAQRIRQQMFAPGGPKGDFRARLKEAMPEGTSEAFLNEVIENLARLSSMEGLEQGKRFAEALEPPAWEKWIRRIEPRVTILVPEKPGYPGQMGVKDRWTMRPEQYDMLLQVLRQSGQEGAPGANAPATPTIIHNEYNSRKYGPDARSQQEAIRNGDRMVGVMGG